MTMTLAAIDASVIGAIFAGVALLIASVTSALLGWRAATHAEAAATKTEAVAAKADTLLVETGKIHTLANDNFSASQKALALANEKIIGLEKLMTNMIEAKKDAHDLALKQVGTASLPVKPTIVPPSPIL